MGKKDEARRVFNRILTEYSDTIAHEIVRKGFQRAMEKGQISSHLYHSGRWYEEGWGKGVDFVATMVVPFYHTVKDYSYGELRGKTFGVDLLFAIPVVGTAGRLVARGGKMLAALGKTSRLSRMTPRMIPKIIQSLDRISEMTLQYGRALHGIEAGEKLRNFSRLARLDRFVSACSAISILIALSQLSAVNLC